MSRSAWLAAERAAHSRALGAAQAFPLFGDGDNTRGIWGGAELSGEQSAAALADARYRDWLAAERHGADSAPGAAYAPPPLVLTADPTAAVQTRLTLPTRARDGRPPALREAAAIIAGLVEEFGELFPDEMAAAVAWLSRNQS